jgi:Domain of unknown function (DUF4194)/Uncharacterized protein conserved in bacteria C-term(DUF2220)
MTEPDLSSAVIMLMKGVVYRDTHDRAWKNLLRLQPHVRDSVEVLGLEVVIDEAEGYAFLRQRPPGEDEGEADPVPRLIPRRALSFHVSLLLALLRKKLAEFDAQGGDTRLMLNRLRRRFPHARSILMDRETLLAHRSQWVPEPTPTRAALDLLTPAEQNLYQALVTGAFGPAVRLEQERVNFAWLEQAFRVSELHARDAVRGTLPGRND